MDNQDQRVVSLAGVVGRAPERRASKDGQPFVAFSLAVTRSYGEDGKTEWYDVTVWNEALIESVMREVYKGAHVAVSGYPREREYEGKIYKGVSAHRVGLVEWLRREAAAGSAEPKAATKPAPRRSAAKAAPKQEDGGW